MIMVQLADLYDADRYTRDPVVQDLRAAITVALESNDQPEDCTACNGTGAMLCPDCEGDGFFPPGSDAECYYCDANCEVQCDQCDGTGEAP